MKRELQPGAFTRTGRKMGLSVLNVELPLDKPLTIEEAFKELELDVNVQNATPFGSVMTDPSNSIHAIEMVLVQVDPPEFLDAKRKIIKQEPGKYEIGSIPFDALLGAIHNNFLQWIVFLDDWESQTLFLFLPQNRPLDNRFPQFHPTESTA